MDKILIKRGIKAELPKILDLGEIVFCVDTRELFVGMGNSLPPKLVKGDGEEYNHLINTLTADFTTHKNSTVLHITSAERSKWNSKAEGSHNHSATDITSGTLSNDRITKASTTVQGIVKLNDATNSTSTVEGATANALKKTYDLANSKANGSHNHSADNITTGTLNNARLNKASTSIQGIVQLNNTVNSTSITEGATANAVKVAYDLANSKANGSHSHTNATTSTSGFMSNADKTKLDGVTAGANNYIHPNDANTRHVTDAEKTNWNNKSNSNHNHDNSYANKQEFDNIKDQISQNKPIILTDDCPIGTIIYYHSKFINQLNNDVWKVCDGSIISNKNYPELYELYALGLEDGAGNFPLPNLSNKLIESVDARFISSNVGKSRTTYLYKQDTVEYSYPMSTISLVPIIKCKQLSKDMQTVAQEWTNFKDNGGIIGGSITSKNSFGILGRRGKYSFTLQGEDTELLLTRDGNTGNGLLFSDTAISPTSAGTKDLGTTNLGFRNIYIDNRNLASNGYTKLPNGLIMQWGKSIVSASVTPQRQAHNINFNITFPNEVLSITGNVVNTTKPDVAFALTYNFYNLSKYNALAITYDTRNATTKDDKIELRWLAIGR